MSQFIGTSMPRGSAGDITRGMFDYTTEVKQNDTTTPVADDGVLVSLTTTGKATPVSDASKVYGIAVRDYRQVGPDGKVWPKDAFVCILRLRCCARRRHTGAGRSCLSRRRKQGRYSH